MRSIALGALLFLFIACFAAIVIEEMFLGGRRKRQLLRQARQQSVGDREDSTPSS